MDWSYLTLCILNTNFSYTATILNIVAICVIMKTSPLSRNFKTLLLSLAVSDLGIGLLAQPIFVAYLAMDSTQANETNKTYSVIYIMTLIPVKLFLFASLFSVTALCADRFIFWPFTFTSDTRNLWHTSILLLPWSQFGWWVHLFHWSGYSSQKMSCT